MSLRGRFISLEGGEGVGKTSNLDAIVAHLRSHGIDPLLVREPGGTPIGERIRQVVLAGEPMLGNTELLLMAASRHELVKQVIEPALVAGQWVVSDRYLDASIAYQGGGRELGVAHVRALHELVGVTLQPDLTLLLDVPIEQGLERMRARGAPDRIEREPTAFFERARSAYRAQARSEPQRIRLIDASRPLEEVVLSVRAALDAFLAQATTLR